jgi:hypothetical protein
MLITQFKASPLKSGLLAVLTVLFLVLVGRQLFGGPRVAEASPLEPPAATSVALIPEPTPEPARPPRLPLPNLPDILVRDLFEADWSAYGQGLPADTTARLPENQDPTEAGLDWVLQLTFTEAADPQKHSAVVNGRRVRIGDEIDEFAVKSIAPRMVILAGHGTERIILRMDGHPGVVQETELTAPRTGEPSVGKNAEKLP